MVLSFKFVKTYYEQIVTHFIWLHEDTFQCKFYNIIC